MKGSNGDYSPMIDNIETAYHDFSIESRNNCNVIPHFLIKLYEIVDVSFIIPYKQFIE
jgi:hypothetical protein